MLLIFDPSTPMHDEQVGDDHYDLSGLGPDGKPFNADDLQPMVDVSRGSRIGWIIPAPH